MRTTLLMLIGAALGACGSENKLDHGPGRHLAPGDDAGKTDVNDPTDETDETDGPGTDTDGPGRDTDDGGTDPDPDGTDPDGTDPNADTDLPAGHDTGLTDEEICDRAAALATYLDAWQTAGDSRVYYCHSNGPNWTFVESDISSCLPHMSHLNDVFPTTGCDS